MCEVLNLRISYSRAPATLRYSTGQPPIPKRRQNSGGGCNDSRQLCVFCEVSSPVSEGVNDRAGDSS